MIEGPKGGRSPDISTVWSCDHAEVAGLAAQVENWSEWDGYPESWPRPDRPSIPLGTASFSPRIKVAADNRLARIRYDLANAVPHYPRDEVREVLGYWKIPI